MADYTWTGGGDGSSWNDPNNWSNDSTGDNPATSSPSGGDDATIGGATITDSGSADNIEVDGELGVVGSLTATGDVIADADVSVIGSLTALANIENDASMTVAGGTVEATEDITNNGDIEIQSGSVTATYDIDDIGSITLQAGSLTAEHDIFGSGSLDIQAGDVEVGQDIQSQGGSIEIESGTVNVGQDISLEGSSLELKSGSVEAGQDILVQGGSIDIEDGSITADNDLDNTGTVTVDGSDSTLTVTNYFDDEMSLSVEDGGTVEAKDLEIQDTADIDDSTLTATGYLSANGGTLTISDGSTVTASSQSSSEATVIATNGGSIEITGSSLDATGPGGGVIGYQGEGSLDIEGGSTVSFESDGGAAAALGIGYVDGDGTVTVDGGSSLTTTGGTVEVDSDSGSQGELDLEGGSTADFTASGGSIDALSVGNGGTGDVIVADGSSLTVSGGGSVIGDASGQGSMEISGGSSATFMSPSPSASSIIIGDDGATGTVSVEGSGSTLTAQEQLTVGNGSGNGSLDISDGASVTASSSDEEDDSAIIIGDNATGDVTVEGSGSTLETDTGNVAVGAYGGDGTLTIEDSGAANFATSDPNVNALYVGNEAGSQGTVTVDGSGSVLTIGTGGVSVGISGSGTVTVSGGGELDITDDTFGLDIATFDGSSGDVDVTGSGSTLNVAGPIYVGDTGAGTLTVEDGADFESTYSDGIGIDVGVNTGGDGTFTIDGNATDVLLDSSDGILIGDAGTGDLLIEDGATLEVSSTDPDANWAVDLGTNPTGNGSITVEGIESTLNVGDGGLDIGNNGTGSVTISDGGTLDIAGSESWIELGLAPSGDGTLNLDGSDTNITLDVSESLFVGDAGTGDLSIEDGATLEVSSTDPDGYFAVTVGNQATGDGTVTVEGAGTALTLGDGGLSVGYAGRGSLTVSQGAMLDITDVTDGLQIGVIAAADGDVNVTGAGTELSVAGETYIGLDGTGSLTIGDGADFESTYADGVTVDLGYDSTGDGTLTVEGSGTDVVLDSGDSVLVGDEGTGNLVVQGGAALDAASANPEAYFAMVLGVEATGDGTVTVDGMGTALTVGDGGLSVGEAGQGSLTVSSGATLTITDEIFGLQIGSEANANGDIDITGDGSTLDSEGPIVIGLAGTGMLTVEDGGTLTVSEDTFISIGSQEGSDGTLTLDGDTSALDYDGPLTVGDAGTGTFEVLDGATYTTGGDITLGAQEDSDGTLNVLGQNSALTVDGTLTVGQDGTGTVNVDATDSADLLTYVLMTAAGAQAIANVNIGSGSGSQANVTVRDTTTIGQDGTATLTLDGGGDGNVGLTTSTFTMGVDAGSVANLDVGANEGGNAILDATDSVTIGDNGTANVTIGGEGLGDSSELLTPLLMTSAGVQAISNISIGKTGSTGVVELNVSGDMTVAGEGQSTIDMLSGTATVGGSLTLGDGDEAGGMLTLSGDGTSFDVSDELMIGNGGTGEIDVDDGASFSAESEVTLGVEDGSSGTLKIDGDGSSFDPPDMTVGSAGSGTVTLSDGGSLETGDLTLGEEESGDGTVTVADADSSLTVDGNLEDGSAGQGTLVIDGDSSVSGETAVGSEAGSTGQITVNGATLELDGETKAGESGSGSILVQQGGTLTAHEVTLGDKLGSSGTLTVDGDGTTVTTDELTVGSSGQGVLNVTDGGQLTSSADSTLGDLASANVATATIDTQGLWSITGGLTVGGSGLAVMTIKGGGNVAATDDVVLGDQSGGASGEVDISGKSADGSTPSGLGFGGTLQVGNDGIGTLKISGGALVAPTSGGKGLIEIAAQSGSTGSVTVSGSGSELEGATLAVGGTDTAAGGAGTLTISDQALADVDDVTVWSSGAVVLAGGALVTDPITIDGGKISGYGSISGDITDNGSITASGGTLSLSGALSGSGSLVIDAGSELDVAGAAAGVDIGFAAAASHETLGIGGITDFHATISDFLAGDTIDLAGLKYQSGDHVDLLAGNKLQITDQSGVYDLQLDSSQSFSGDYFSLTADSSGTGTHIAESNQPCYCPGTLIQTDKGDVLVETLAIGDRVLTHSGALRSIKWIGRRSYSGRFVLGRKSILPVCIKAGALGESLPRRDLWISPHHAMYLDGVLVEARDLINGVSIVQAEHADEITYIHVELDSHDVILAEGAWSETFLDESNRGMFHNAHEYHALYPQPQRDPQGRDRYYAPRLDGGFEVERIRHNIAALAGIAIQSEAHGPLRGFIDLADAHWVRGWAQDCDHSNIPVCLAIYDGETLLGHVLADRYRADLAEAGLGSGRHAFAFRLPTAKTDASSNIIVTRALDGSRLAMTQKARAALMNGRRLKQRKSSTLQDARRAIMQAAHRKRRTFDVTMSVAMKQAWAEFKLAMQTAHAFTDDRKALAA